LILLGCGIRQCYGALRLPESSAVVSREKREKGERRKEPRLRGFSPGGGGYLEK